MKVERGIFLCSLGTVRVPYALRTDRSTSLFMDLQAVSGTPIRYSRSLHLCLGRAFRQQVPVPHVVDVDIMNVVAIVWVLPTDQAPTTRSSELRCDFRSDRGRCSGSFRCCLSIFLLDSLSWRASLFWARLIPLALRGHRRGGGSRIRSTAVNLVVGGRVLYNILILYCSVMTRSLPLEKLT